MDTRFEFGEIFLTKLMKSITNIQTNATSRYPTRRKIKAYHDLEETLKDVDAVLFVVPTKVTRLVAQQVAKVLNHKVVIMHG